MRSKVSRDRIEAANAIYEMAEDWKLSNRTISWLFKGFPLNNDPSTVTSKVLLINGLYNSNLKTPLSMVHHILSLNELQGELEKGDARIVDKVASVEGTTYRSFASKYAFFSNKSAYPMFDKYVAEALSVLIGKPVPDKSYLRFYELMLDLTQGPEMSGIPWEELDRYLWLLGQLPALRNDGRGIGKEIKKLYQEAKPLFERIEG